MEIRKRLTYQFALITAVILIIVELFIYVFSFIIWKDSFDERLKVKSNAIALLLSELKGSEANLINLIDRSSGSYLPFEEVRIYNFEKRLVFTSKPDMSFPVTDAFIDQVKKNGYAESKYRDYRIVGIIYNKGSSGRLIVITGAIDVYGIRKLYDLRVILGIAFILAVIAAYITGRVFANKALEPILRVIEQVPAINEQNLNLRVDEGNGRDEIARLAKTFNRMLERLENAFKVQMTFIANASHEMRTPLSYIMGQLEVQMLRERTREEYKEALISVLEDVKMMNETTNRLLLLTLASFDTASIPFIDLRIDDILWEARKTVMKANPANKVNISFREPDGAEQQLTVQGNEQLLKVAFVNLMDNGCKYSEDHTVNVSLDNDQDKIIVCFSDHGIGIPEEELSLIFEPFYRGKNTLGKKGHGLGLSIVRKIIQQHSGTITVTSKLNEETIFTIGLPLISSSPLTLLKP